MKVILIEFRLVNKEGHWETVTAHTSSTWELAESWIAEQAKTPDDWHKGWYWWTAMEEIVDTDHEDAELRFYDREGVRAYHVQPSNPWWKEYEERAKLDN